MPFATFPFMIYQLCSFVVDRANMLTILEPLPPSSGLCMRYTLTILLPAIIPLHYAVALVGYNLQARSGDMDKRVSPEAYTKMVTYAVLGLLINGYLLLEIFVLQRRLAMKRGLMTPYQVMQSAFSNEEGFGFTSRADPYHAKVDFNLADCDVSIEQVKQLYTAQCLNDGSGSSTLFAMNEKKRAWELARARQQNKMLLQAAQAGGSGGGIPVSLTKMATTHLETARALKAGDLQHALAGTPAV